MYVTDARDATLNSIENLPETKNILNSIFDRISSESKKGNFIIKDLWDSIDCDSNYTKERIEKYLSYMGYSITISSNNNTSSTFDQRQTTTSIQWL